MKKLGLSLWMLSCMYAGFCDQDGSIKAVIDRHKFPVNENAILTVTVSGSNLGDPEIQKVDAISIYPSGQSQNITIVNSQMATSASYTYVIQPHSTGTITIPPIQIKQNGSVLMTEAIQLEITKASSVETRKNQSQPERPQQLQDKESSRPGQDLAYAFSEANVNQRKAYVGEQITFSYKFYRKVNLLDQPNYTPPDFTGFWVEELPPEKIYYEMINEQRYLVSELNVALFPTTSGELTIGGAQLKCRVPVRGQSRDPFSFMDEDPFQFFNSNNPFEMFSGQAMTLKTDPLQIQVQDLPKSGQPQDFSGAVGSFTIQTQTDKTKIAANEPITLSIVLEGDGNIQAITEPKFTLDEDLFKSYDSGQSSEIKKDNGIVHGKKIFKKLFVPLKAGTFEIPGIQFSFFDPQKKSYQTLQAKPIAIEVQKGKPETPMPAQSQGLPEKEAVNLIHQDICFIETHFDAFTNQALRPSLKTIELSLIFPFSLFLISCGSSLRRRFLEKNQEFVRLKKAYKKSASKIKSIRSRTKTLTQREFYDEVEKVFQEYFFAKFSISLQGGQFQDIQSILKKRGANEAVVQNLIKILEESYLARFTPVELDQSRKLEILKKTHEVLTNLEKKL